MKIKDLRFICWWEYQLKLGRLKFGISYGIVGGLVFGLINLLILAISSLDNFVFTFSNILQTTTLCLLLSIFFYLTVMWYFYNWNYRRIKKRQG